MQGPGSFATKQIRRGGAGCLEKIDYSEGAKWWRMSPFAAANHDAMAVQLRKLATMPQSLLVMGDWVPGLDLALEHRRRWARSEPLKEHPARRAARVDGNRCGRRSRPSTSRRCRTSRGGRDLCARPPAAPRVLQRDDARLTDFEQWPAGATLFRGRLWFLLDRPIPLGDLRAWAMGVRTVGGAVDPAVEPSRGSRSSRRGRSSWAWMIRSPRTCSRRW